MKTRITELLNIKYPIFQGGMLASVVKIGGTFGTSVVTIIAVPLLYPIFKRILKKD